jgi:hypothetical protein
VHAEVGVDAGDDEAGHEGRGQELERRVSMPYRPVVSLRAAASSFTS